MEKQQNVAQFQQKFVIRVDANIAKIVLTADRHEIATAYLQMFSGFAWVNWTNKYSLGRAWQTALAQCGSYIENKAGKNPASKYLVSVYAGHKKYWSRVIMMHNARENTINPDDEKIKQLRAHGANMIQAAMDKINLILARYNERTEELIATQTKQATTQATAGITKNTPQQVKAQKPQPQQQQLQSVPNAHATHGGATVAPVAKESTVRMPQAVAQKAQQTHKPVATPAMAPAPVVKPVVIPAPQPVATMAKPQVAHTPQQKHVATPIKPLNTAQKQDNRVAFNTAKQRIEQQSAQAKLAMQQKLKIWMIGQKYQNAA